MIDTSATANAHLRHWRDKVGVSRHDNRNTRQLRVWNSLLRPLPFITQLDSLPKWDWTLELHLIWLVSKVSLKSGNGLGHLVWLGWRFVWHHGTVDSVQRWDERTMDYSTRHKHWYLRLSQVHSLRDLVGFGIRELHWIAKCVNFHLVCYSQWECQNCSRNISLLTPTELSSSRNRCGTDGDCSGIFCRLAIRCQMETPILKILLYKVDYHISRKLRTQQILPQGSPKMPLRRCRWGLILTHLSVEPPLGNARVFFHRAATILAS